MKNVIAVCAVVSTLLGCSVCRTEQPSVLKKQVRFACNQTLLRDAIADLNGQVGGRIILEPRLNEVADLDVCYFTKTPDDSRVSLATALNILRTYVVSVHKIHVDWKVDGQKIFFFYAGNEEEYKGLRKRDQK